MIDLFRIINTFEQLQSAQVAGKRLFDFYMATTAAGSDGGGRGGARLLTGAQGSSKDADTSAVLARLVDATYSWHATDPLSGVGPAAPPSDLAADGAQAEVEGGAARRSSKPSTGAFAPAGCARNLQAWHWALSCLCTVASPDILCMCHLAALQPGAVQRPGCHPAPASSCPC
jgi:hypothetical protein